MTFLLEEDSALKSYLSNITVTDLKSDPRPVNVWYGLPDIEARNVTYPYIMIDLIDVEPAAYRKHAGAFQAEATYLPDEEEPGLHQYRMRPKGEPFDLLYQVACYARDPRHDRSLLRSILKRFPGNQAIIPILPTVDIPDQQGNCRPAFVEQIAKVDTIVEGKKVFRNVLTLRIPSELDPDAQDLVATVLSVVINKQPTQYIPSSYDIV